MVMDSSLLARLHAFSMLFFLPTSLYMRVVSCTGSQIVYTDHCTSVVPESTTTSPEFIVSPFPESQTGYYDGGDRLFGPDSPQIEASLILQSANVKYFEKGWSLSPRRTPMWFHFWDLPFTLEGFWSRATGKLCMIGWSSIYSKKGDLLKLAAILKLNHVKNSSTITSLVTGTLDSLYHVNRIDYFDPISLLMFPQAGYKYTKVSKKSDDGCSIGTNVPDNLSVSLPLSRTICSMFLRGVNLFELEYGNGCDSAKNCNPFGDGIGYLPQFMSLSEIQCSEDRQSLRFLVEFPNSSFVRLDQSYNFSTTLMGEGTWNGKKKRLCIVACRIFNASSTLENSRLGDCTIRISLRFPAIWSIRKTASVLGEIWSIKTVNAPGYFDRVLFRDAQNGLIFNGLKYEYTQLDKVRKSMPKKNPISKRRQQYPVNYEEMSFDMLVKSSRGKIAWGFSFPLSIGDYPFQRFPYLMSLSNFRPINSVYEGNNIRSSPVNISYQLSIALLVGVKLDGHVTIFNLSSDMNSRVQISSEGVYDDETGDLCMVGCRRLRLHNHINSNDSFDCQILVNIQFPPLNSKKSRSFIKGSIESKREKSDPHYFETLYLSGAAYSIGQARQLIRRMDLEIVMVILSTTFACIFIGLELLHVKKHPGVLPSISLLMLVILALGYLIPLLLNFEALFLQKPTPETVLLRSGGWLEVKEVIVRIVTMMAFFLQFRLLQRTWVARWSDEKQKSLWLAEKRAAFVCLPVYLAGCFIAFLVKSRKSRFGTGMHSSHSSDQQQFFLGGSRPYAGLVLDGFLFPQIIFNIFQNSRANALSYFFYIGTTIIHLLPHGYDLYRAHKYAQEFAWSYIYADPDADFYSTAWDFVILVLGLFSAAIIYLQQRYGGCWFLRHRFQDQEIYEMVTASCEK
ncbi:hypothetical protein REPUB_Repub11eG0057800 [Reevesia pubescens]